MPEELTPGCHKSRLYLLQMLLRQLGNLSLLNCRRLQTDKAIAERDCYGVRSIERSELAHRGVHVLIDGSSGYLQNLADLARGSAFRHPAENLILSWR